MGITEKQQFFVYMRPLYTKKIVKNVRIQSKPAANAYDVPTKSWATTGKFARTTTPANDATAATTTDNYATTTNPGPASNGPTASSPTHSATAHPLSTAAYEQSISEPFDPHGLW